MASTFCPTCSERELPTCVGAGRDPVTETCSHDSAKRINTRLRFGAHMLVLCRESTSADLNRLQTGTFELGLSYLQHGKVFVCPVPMCMRGSTFTKVMCRRAVHEVREVHEIREVVSVRYVKCAHA